MPINQNNNDNLNKEKFEQLTTEAWEIILESINDLKEKKHTFSDIAQILGIKNRSLVCEWLNKKRELPLSSIAAMLHYLDVFGYAIIGDTIVKKDATNTKQEKESSAVPQLSLLQIAELQKENEELRMKNRVLQEILTNAIDTKKIKKDKKKDKN